MIGKIILGIGILGILLGIAVAGISAALVPLTNGRTSFDEALLGIIPGLIVLFFSFFIAVIGIVVMIVARKKK
ncbi:MAG TPA: hypothetical protein PKA82_06675 [Pyrinomonadaceae bacterium]|nr:hypothetical protein [Pyrinomonadaceae bacterium]